MSAVNELFGGQVPACRHDGVLGLPLSVMVMVTVSAAPATVGVPANVASPVGLYTGMADVKATPAMLLLAAVQVYWAAALFGLPVPPHEPVPGGSWQLNTTL